MHHVVVMLLAVAGVHHGQPVIWCFATLACDTHLLLLEAVITAASACSATWLCNLTGVCSLTERSWHDFHEVKFNGNTIVHVLQKRQSLKHTSIEENLRHLRYEC